MSRSVDDFAPKIPSGIDAIDREWGGLYDGGTYLAYGRISNGRGLVALLFSQVGAALDDRTLFVSSERSKDLIIQAASIGFDIRRAHRLGVFKLVRTNQLLRPHPDKVAENFSPFDRLISQVRSYGPRRLVVSDAMAFAGTADPLSSDFRSAYSRFLEQIESLGTTLLVTLPEPTNDVARRFTEFVMSMSTAAIFVGRDDDDDDNDGYQLTLIPQIGHITRKRKIAWNLEELVERAERVDASYRALQGRIAASGGSFLLPAAKIPGAGQPRRHEIEITSGPRTAVTGSGQQADTLTQTGRQPHSQSRGIPEVTVHEVAAPHIARHPKQPPAETPQGQPQVSDVREASPPAPTHSEPAARESDLTHRSTPDLDQSRAVVEPEDEQVVPHQTLDDLARDPFDRVTEVNVIDRVLEDVLRGRESQASLEYPDREGLATAGTVEHQASSTPVSRSEFTDKLQSFFDEARANKSDFLIVAMRVDRATVGAHDFAVLDDCVADAIRERDVLFTDARKGRLVLLMPGASADHAQSLFANVKARLRAGGPAGADTILRKVSAIVVPNGNPFEGAREFLSYVLDGD